jgi:metal-sulfur cluster biosynthetic enzyme
MTEPDLVNALRDCYDTLQQRNSARGINIVDLGLVRSTSLARDTEAPGANVRGVPPRYVARITLRAPSSDDTRNAQLRAQIENRLAGLPEISRTEITMLPALFPILSGRQP